LNEYRLLLLKKRTHSLRSEFFLIILETYLRRVLPVFDSLAFELLLAVLVDFLTWLLLRLVLLDVETDDLELRAGSLLLTVATCLEALLPETADDLLRVAAVL